MKVNTIIIGAGRSGTTSVYEYLSNHPEVNFSITKEVHYFSIEDLYKRGEKYFHSLFEQNENKIIATADTYLLVDKKAPERIRNYNPDMKLIVMLRDPVERAYSNYNYSVNYGHEEENNSFLKTLQLEKGRLNNDDIVALNNTCHFYGSLYFQHLQYWEQFFPKENFILLKLDDLKKDPDLFYKNLTSKLNISNISFKQSETKFNAGSSVKSKWLQQLLLNRESTVRRVISFVLRPFRKLVINSGIIDKVYAMNKKEVDQKKISKEEFVLAQQYFDFDLKNLNSVYGISFEQNRQNLRD